MRFLDSRWDPSAPEPIPGLGAYYDIVASESRTEPDAALLDGLVRQLGARAGHDAFTHLGSIGRPTLVCAGRFDELAPLARSQFLADQVADAKLRVFDGGHLFLLQAPSAFGAIVDHLLAGPVGNTADTGPAGR